MDVVWALEGVGVARVGRPAAFAAILALEKGHEGRKEEDGLEEWEGGEKY